MKKKKRKQESVLVKEAHLYNCKAGSSALESQSNSIFHFHKVNSSSSELVVFALMDVDMLSSSLSDLGLWERQRLTTPDNSWRYELSFLIWCSLEPGENMIRNPIRV